MTRGALHHVELWIADLGAVAPSWDWLLGALGYSRTRSWVGGEAWTPPGGGADLVLEAGRIAGGFSRGQPRYWPATREPAGDPGPGPRVRRRS